MKKRKALTPIERFIALSDVEKDAEVAQYEKGTDPKDWRPLAPAQWMQWRRIKRKSGRRAPFPPFPAPDANGNYHAIAYGRSLLARRIVAARRRARWTQAELARRAGVRKETIHRIEVGKNSPDESTFTKIEKAFVAGSVSV